MWCRLSPPGWRTSRIGSCQSCWRAGAQEHHFSKGLTPCPAPAAWWLATRPCTNHAVSWEEPFVSCNFQGQEMGSLLPVRRETELWGQGFSWFCERQAAWEYHGLARRRQEANISTLEGEETLRSPLGQLRCTPFTWARRREKVASWTTCCQQGFCSDFNGARLW